MKSHRLRRRPLRLLSRELLFFSPFLLIGALLFHEWWIFPNVQELKTHFPHVSYSGPKKPFQVKIQKSKPVAWTSLKEISKGALGAILVSEDWAFFQHPGYDIKQIQEVVEEALEKGGVKRGASTITQQVAKNIYLSSERSLLRKGRELLIAMQMEQHLGKKRILEMYFNIAEWGEGIFGIRQAAGFYFRKSPAELTPREGAFLAMLLPSPKKYSVSFRKKSLSPFARKMIRSILEKMAQAKYLTPEALTSELHHPFSWEIAPIVDPLEPPAISTDEEENESEDS